MVKEMNYISKKNLAVFLALAVSFIGTGCGGGNVEKPSYDMSGISFEDASYTYDGEAHSLAISGTLPEGVTVEYIGNGKTDAGTYTVTADFTGSAEFQTIEDMSATLLINKSTYDISGISFNDSIVVYDGKAHSLEIEGDLPEGVSVIYTGNEQITSGEHIVTANFVGSSNYEPMGSKTATLTISALDYEIEGDNVIILGLPDKSVKNLVIPDTIGGKTVTSINGWAFGKCNNIMSVFIPNHVTTIGYMAFYSCLSLTSIVISNSVQTINDQAFEDCTALMEVYNLSDLTFTVGDSSNGSIAKYAYDIYTSLESVSKLSVIEDFVIYTNGATRAAVRYIGVSPFATIPTTVTIVKSGAFNGVDNLVSITIPHSVALIEDSTFMNNHSLVEVYNFSSLLISRGDTANGHVGFYAYDIYVTSESASRLSIDNGLIVYTAGDTKELVKYNGHENNVTIPNTIKSIGNYAFYNNIDLISIDIPDSVTSIGESAFEMCSLLKSFSTSDNVTSIGTRAFLECGNLKSVTLSQGLSVITSYLFYNCLNLTSVTIPSGITEIGRMAFYHCNKLVSVTIPNSMININPEAFIFCYALAEVYNLSTLPITVGDVGNGYVAAYAKDVYTSLDSPSKLSNDEGLIVYTDGNKKTVVCYNGEASSVVIPSGIISIGTYAFGNCYNLTAVSIPNSVSEICDNAFSECVRLVSVVLPYGVNSIGNSAFDFCISLTSFIIAESVTSIGTTAFFNCSKLTSIIIPNAVVSMGDMVFTGCSSSMVINCVAASQPAAWSPMWNGDGLTVNWGYVAA